MQCLELKKMSQHLVDMLIQIITNVLVATFVLMSVQQVILKWGLASNISLSYLGENIETS